MKLFRTIYKLMLPACIVLGAATVAQAQYVDDEQVDTMQRQSNTAKQRPLTKFSPKNMIVGSHLTFGFYNGVSGSVAPYVGYRFFDLLAVGAGVSYAFSTTTYYNNVRTSSVFGASIFGRVRPMREGIFRSLYLHGELEALHAELANPSYNPSVPSSGIPQTIARAESRANVGLGYATTFSDGWGFTVEYLYNVLHYRNATPIYSTPFIYRIGVYYGF